VTTMYTNVQLRSSPFLGHGGKKFAGKMRPNLPQIGVDQRPNAPE
jgi:hypothetical protein